MPTMKHSVGFKAWLETTNDEHPLRQYKSVLRGVLAQMEQLEAERDELREKIYGRSPDGKMAMKGRN